MLSADRSLVELEPTSVVQAEPRRVTRSMRALLLVAAALVFLAGVQLFLFPLRTARYFAWTIDVPMTAVFLGGAYWSSMVFEWSAARRRHWGDARIAAPTVLVFTTLTLVVTAHHHDHFHFGAGNPLSTRVVTWAWLAIYVVVPVLMVVVAVVQHRQAGFDRPRTAPLPPAIRRLISVMAVALLGIGVALFVDPQRSAGWWPWPLTPLTAGAVGAWCLGLGVAAAHARWEDDVQRLRPAAHAFAAFGVLQAIALARHGDELDWARPASYLYVAFLATATAVGVTVSVSARRVDAGDLRAATMTATLACTDCPQQAEPSQRSSRRLEVAGTSTWTDVTDPPSRAGPHG
jgi:hypothetical protein